jgi:Sec-independent protein translocase protein TatA
MDVVHGVVAVVFGARRTTRAAVTIVGAIKAGEGV